MQHTFRAGELRDAAEAVAAHRSTELTSLADVTGGWSTVGQLKWAGWVRKQHLADAVGEDPDDQVNDIRTFIDPVLTGDVPPNALWDPTARSWATAPE